ncbi:NUDIX hydrolase [Piscibacillus salipiscarius]|uniref:NUDIX domain-containing protein n=1 Tax=Piscibacillus salipiscarius TaxID=299480 RepID=A0ABW5QBA4_9BACI|nr:8-oxo-dGTP diphosphatase [Piscibacillus salipiscarius]
MQRVTNAVYIHDSKILMLKKPRRNWYVAPGGKMELGESITRAVKREYKEETGLSLLNPRLSSVFTFVMDEKEEWMMFTYVSHQADGNVLDHTPEGVLEWISVNDVLRLPMAEGDRTIIKHAINHPEYVLTGTFYYTDDFNLQKQIIDDQKDLLV